MALTKPQQALEAPRRAETIQRNDIIVPDVIFEKRKRNDAVLITDDTPIQILQSEKQL